MCFTIGPLSRLKDTVTRDELDAALRLAQQKADGTRVSELYGAAADLSEKEGRTDEACFFWVQAYVFALEAGLTSADHFHAKLKQYGREE